MIELGPSVVLYKRQPTSSNPNYKEPLLLYPQPLYHKQKTSEHSTIYHESRDSYTSPDITRHNLLSLYRYISIEGPVSAFPSSFSKENSFAREISVIEPHRIQQPPTSTTGTLSKYLGSRNAQHHRSRHRGRDHRTITPTTITHTTDNMQSQHSIESLLQIVLNNVLIESTGEGRYRVHYHTQSPLTAAAIWCLAPDPKPTVEFIKSEDFSSNTGCVGQGLIPELNLSRMPQEQNGSFAIPLLVGSKIQTQLEDNHMAELSALIPAIASYQQNGFQPQLMEYISKRAFDNMMYLTSTNSLTIADLYLWEVIRGQNFRWRRYSASFGPALEKWLSQFETSHPDLVHATNKALDQSAAEHNPQLIEYSYNNGSSLKNMLRESDKFYRPLRKEASVGALRCTMDDSLVKPSWWSETK
ncbi:hypothetical protein PROFUN_09866 [Planoprotostelium fungivorum]|uniref:GST C-terminal domain-containing protein n=1 Tax=Planoprotostelium fungivorum TaxID=1890364 RepID=A0A2P6NGE9_9EUKA|nr:hypothetical protein PROFUN_09866 [Planoprotostelium fungivorum]